VVGHAARAVLREDEVLCGLRAKGLTTYPSPLLGRLLEELPEVFAAEVLPRLPPADRTVLAQVGPLWLAAVVSSGLSRAGKTAGVPLKLKDFVGSIARLSLARDNGCPWVERTCSFVARGGPGRGGPGDMDVLRWAREHGCPWGTWTCAFVARSGVLEDLVWAYESGCPWDRETCALAASRGHLELLQWARERDCPWDARTTSEAAEGGHLAVLQWAREHDCPWDEWTCALAAWGGHLELMQWAREHGAPWDEAFILSGPLSSGVGRHEAALVRWLAEHGGH